jgi:hypothetical protein
MPSVIFWSFSPSILQNIKYPPNICQVPAVPATVLPFNTAQYIFKSLKKNFFSFPKFPHIAADIILRFDAVHLGFKKCSMKNKHFYFEKVLQIKFFKIKTLLELNKTIFQVYIIDNRSYIFSLELTFCK